MHIETILLLLESVLLAFTIALLIYSIKEGKERKALLLEVGRATRILTRQEYFLMVRDSMSEAKSEVVACITGRFPTGDDIKRTKEIIETIERLSSQGVKIRYLIPKFPDRLYIGYLYTKAGAEVLYTGCLIVHDIRYTVVDDAIVVIGIPEATGEKEATKKGYKIPSEALSSILKEHFDNCAKKTTSYEEYIKELVNQTGATPKMLSKEFHIDEDEIIRITGRK